MGWEIIMVFSAYSDSRDDNDFRARDVVCRGSAVIYAPSLSRTERCRWAATATPRTTKDAPPAACISCAVTSHRTFVY